MVKVGWGTMEQYDEDLFEINKTCNETSDLILSSKLLTITRKLIKLNEAFVHCYPVVKCIARREGD